ncbi:transcriptional regulator, Fur family [Verrucomicrobiia bacterium DG1235]|nr:transcriptional regulator, Fur family [Verrucomicrobiae bacterium DG1235]
MESTNQHYDEAISSLKRERYRITEPRKALLRLLIEAEKPLSAEEAHAALGADCYDLVTVYRNLETFDSAGIATRIPTEAGKSLYELNAEEHHHHHIICRKCHKAERLDHCEIEKLETLATKLGFTEVTHVLELYGVCDDCR